MKTWNQIETQLRSWTPRPPSERIREGLFGESSARPDASPVQAMRPALWQWLAPAMALFVMALTLSSQSGAGPGFTTLIVSPRGGISEMALKNPDLAAYFPSSGHSSHNGWPVATFDWTNKSRPVATENAVWGTPATNSLIQ